MIYLAIIIWAIGLILLPLSRLYVIWRKRTPDSRFADTAYQRRFRTIIRCVSVGCMLIALLIISLTGD